MNRLYPLKFSPVFKDKLWGGQKIKTHLGLDFSPLPNCGEAWVLSGVNGNETIVAEGWLEGNHLNELVEIYMDELVGGNVYEAHGDEFPLLIKFIDSHEWLSIQVHPNDELAASRHNGSGKTEMWYVLQADENAELICGFNQKVDKTIYLKHLESKSLTSILKYEKVKEGDVFYMPSGSLHALGPGILLAEIQQTSDITYRISDWDRVDAHGRSRELHTELAVDALNFNPSVENHIRYKAMPNQSTSLVHSPYFTARLLKVDKTLSKNYDELDSFVIYLGVKGEAIIHYEHGAASLKAGECLLIPASVHKTIIAPVNEAHLLEVFIP